jgi:hypothetical protein
MSCVDRWLVAAIVDWMEFAPRLILLSYVDLNW